jgi:hypothetical protein
VQRVEGERSALVVEGGLGHRRQRDVQAGARIVDGVLKPGISERQNPLRISRRSSGDVSIYRQTILAMSEKTLSGGKLTIEPQ